MNVLVPQNWLGGAKFKTHLYPAKLKEMQISIWIKDF